MSGCKPCTIPYSKGNGTGVSEALGNWGFSNEVASPGHELSRIQCLLARMDALKSAHKCDQSCNKKKSMPPQCDFSSKRCDPNDRPCWVNNKKKFLIMYSSVEDTLLTSNHKLAAQDAMYPLAGRRFVVQGNDKWYKLGPLCCPQPSCPVPSCPPPCQQIFCCNSYCC